MSKALIISVIMHGMFASVLAVMGYTFHVPNTLPPGKHIPVNIMTRGEFTKVKFGGENGKDTDKPAKAKPVAKKQSKRKKPRKAIREATTKKKTTQASEKKAVKKAKASKKVKKKAPKKKKVLVEKKKNRDARKAKKEFNPDQIAALLDKQPSDRDKLDDKKKKEDKNRELAKGSDDGEADKLTADDYTYVASRVSSCWNMPIGQLGAENIEVKVHLKLKVDGTLASKPQIRASSNNIVGKVVEETAVRAVIACQPYKLPVSKYRNWKDMVLIFDPKDMYRE
ncbi:MAG: hypothetical protein ACRBBN_05570 [Methyloligellaceae bacterium]